MERRRRWLVSLIGLLLLVVVFAFIALAVGPSGVAPLGTIRALFSGGGEDVYQRVVLQIRLPRVLLALFAGISLAVSGAAFQGILRNPLADPYILGVSSGAAFGASIAIVSRLPSPFSVPLLAFGGAVGTIFLVYSLATFNGRIPRDILLLSGVVVSAFFASLIMLVMSVAGRELHQIIYLLMGSLGTILTQETLPLFLGLLGFSLVCCGGIYGFARELNLLSLGEEEAQHLGVDIEFLKRAVFIVSSLSVGATVSLCGAIGFVGLIVPHIGRLAVGPDHRVLIPASAAIGAMLLLLADTVARSVSPFEIPVGVVTAIFGVPFFIWLLRRRRRG